jgi:hypothetical protein
MRSWNPVHVLRSGGWLLVAGALLAPLGCGANTTITAASYKSSCSVAADCAAVYFGDTCGCVCFNGAINRSDLPRYQADLAAVQSSCAPKACLADCANPSPTCTAGVCGLTP